MLTLVARACTAAVMIGAVGERVFCLSLCSAASRAALLKRIYWALVFFTKMFCAALAGNVDISDLIAWTRSRDIERTAVFCRALCYGGILSLKHFLLLILYEV